MSDTRKKRPTDKQRLDWLNRRFVEVKWRDAISVNTSYISAGELRKRIDKLIAEEKDDR